MAPFRLCSNTTAYVPVQECEYLLGTNDDHGRPSPWKEALKVVHLLGMETDGEKQYSVSRHYTIRPAKFPEDETAFHCILSAEIATVQNVAGEEVDPAQVKSLAEQYTDENGGHVLLACRILVDGGDDNSSVNDRLYRTPEDKWRDGPVPKGRSAFSVDGRYVLMIDMPPLLLEEDVVGFVGLRAQEPEASTGANEAAKVCELERLFVERHEDGSLNHVLVELMAEYAQDNGYGILRLAPSMMGGGPAEDLFEKASLMGLGKANASIRRDVENGGGNLVEVWEMDLSKWQRSTRQTGGRAA